MAITSEIIGKLGGANIETITVNQLIKKGEGFKTLHRFTTDRPSLVTAIVTHDNTDSFGGTMGDGTISLRGPDVVHYNSSYIHSTARGKPLTIAAEAVGAGSWDVSAACVYGTKISSYTVKTITLCIVNLYHHTKS